MTILLQTEALGKSFGSVVALKDVSLTLRAGSVHAIAGENGAGKSTLMKMIGGVFQPSSGSMYLNGKSVSWKSVKDAQKHGVSVIFQEFILLPNLSVAENMCLGHEPRKFGGVLDRGKMRDQSVEALGQLGLSLDPDRLTSTLSLAQQQMVEIAKGVMREAVVFVFDEPTAALGDNEAEQLFSIIQRLQKAGKGILYVSHRLPEVFRLCDEITVLKDAAFVTHFKTDQASSEKLVQAMVGRPLEALFPERDPDASPGGKAVVVDAVRLPGSVRPVAMTLHKNEIVGLAGLEGQGQIDLTRAIFGDLPVSSGSIRVGESPVHNSTPSNAIARGIGLIPEDRKSEGLFLDLSVSDNILVGLLPGTPLWKVAPRRRSDILRQIKTLRIRLSSADQPIRSLSGGNQQKALLARWLLRGVEILICEEPTRGVDVGAKAEIYRLLRELADRGVPVLVTSRELPELIGLCDRLIVLREKAGVGELRARDATEDRVMQAAILGEHS